MRSRTPSAEAASSSIRPSPTLASELGFSVVFGPAAILLGFALIAFVLGARTLVPAWLRWSTLVAGLAGVVSLAFFPARRPAQSGSPRSRQDRPASTWRLKPGVRHLVLSSAKRNKSVTRMCR